jgi:hypothetical protein
LIQVGGLKNLRTWLREVLAKISAGSGGDTTEVKPCKLKNEVAQAKV